MIFSVLVSMSLKADPGAVRSPAELITVSRVYPKSEYDGSRCASGDGAVSLPGPGNSGLREVTGDLSHAVDTWTW